MSKKCKKCGVALEGFLYKWIAGPLFDIKPSDKEEDTCNKCETVERRYEGAGEGSSED